MKKFSAALTWSALALAFGLACTSQPRVSPSGSGGNGGSGSGTTGGSGGSTGSGGTGTFILPDSGPVGGSGSTGAADGPASQYSGGVTRPCVDLECRQSTCVLGDCKQMPCAGGGKTTLKGTIFDPAGKVPLYNVVVYVPNAALDPIATGPSCDRCDSPVSGKPIASALTDTKGEFVLDNVPIGADVPLVIQVGKWRRQIVLPAMQACTANQVNDPNLLRLPRNQKEGNIPRIALTTGGADRLECLLRKIGIDESEFTPSAAAGRVNFYGGKGGLNSLATTAYAPTLNAGATFEPAIGLWGTPANLDKYDIVILSCEGNWFAADKSPAARQGLIDYANKGGRIFASHWHGVWVQMGPQPWNTVANFVPPTPLGNMSSLPDLPDPFVTSIDTSFPKGEALADWLVNVQASMTRGQLSIEEGKHTVLSVNSTLATRWIHSSAIPVGGRNTDPMGVQYLSFNAPVGTPAAMQCGRTVLTDIHVSAGDTAGPPFPMGCVTTELSPQEKALEFMLFDLSSCVQPDAQPPRPPVIP